jgi:signal transduction histidine kinase
MTAEDLDAYASLAAHQLGEAVTLLRGYVAQLERDAAGLGDGVGDSLRGIAAGAERTQRFVDDLLDLRVAGATEVGDGPVDLDAALAAAREALAGPLAQPGVSLVASPLPPVRGSAALLERLLVHLLRGALAARAGSGVRIEVDGRVEGDRVVVEVRDDGSPLDAGLAERLFEPFARVRGRGPLVGAGVGPSVCRRIVERHGGAIAARPREGGGAVLELWLPHGG